MSKPVLLCLLLSLPLPVMAEVAGMPLTEGYYAEAGTLCGEGNEATLAYLHQGGINTSFGMCAFEAVTAQAEGGFSYAAVCAHPEQGVEALDEGIITPKGAEAFKIHNGTMTLDYVYCPSSELPPPYGD